MSYDHKDLVQRESRSILSKSGRIQINKNTWVTREVAIKQYGLKDWGTEENRIENQYHKELQSYKKLSFISKIFTKKPKKEKNAWSYNKIELNKC